MSEPTPAPDGAPVTPDPAPQQPGDGTPAPDGGGVQGAEFYKSEAKLAFEKRDAATAAARLAAEQNEATQKQLEKLQAEQVSPEDRELLAQIKKDAADKARQKAMSDGDVDALAAAARAPVESERDELAQENTGLKDQVSTLLRDQNLTNAIASSQTGFVDASVVKEVLSNRVRMTMIGGQLVPEFFDAKGQVLFDGAGKVSTMEAFVAKFATDNPGFCKAQSQPGSGATPPGPGSAGTATAGRKPKTVAEWNAMTPEQKDAADMQPGELSKITYPDRTKGGLCG